MKLGGIGTVSRKENNAASSRLASRTGAPSSLTISQNPKSRMDTLNANNRRTLVQRGDQIDILNVKSQ